ncbi:MAG: hypothetical protein OXH85_11690 [Truepera sp.]|nr:hypothetical protein [Truepera sp.]
MIDSTAPRLFAASGITRRTLNASVDSTDFSRRHSSTWRRVGEALRPAAAFVLLLLLAGCVDDSPTAVELAPPTGEDLPPDQLARAVAERTDSADFVEPAGDGLVLQVRDDLLFVKGVVNSGSEGEMIALLNRSPGVRTVVLTMVPGSAADETNVALGRKLRSAGMTTYLPARGLVASGGTDLLLSGSRRIVEHGARVGVHSWASDSGSGDEIPRDDPRHLIYLDYYRDMDIPEAFYWFTLEAAPPDGIHWMTNAEMARYRVHTVLR